jgi:hypothetical protein
LRDAQQTEHFDRPHPDRASNCCRSGKSLGPTLDHHGPSPIPSGYAYGDPVPAIDHYDNGTLRYRGFNLDGQMDGAWQFKETDFGGR